MATTRLRCRRCSAELIHGEASGFVLDLDARELDSAQELTARVAGLPTYTHHTVADVIAYRYQLVIKTRPAGHTPRQTVHVIHHCPLRPRPPSGRH